MQPQFIPNGTLVVFNKDHSCYSSCGEALCEVVASGNKVYHEKDAVYRLKFNEPVPKEMVDKISTEEDNSFWCHVIYFELADIPVDVPDIFSLL